jgi:nitroreductase
LERRSAQNKGRTDVDFNELVKTRYSVRKYANRPVEEDRLAVILEAARLAPTAANKQPFRLFVVQGETLIRAMATAAGAYRWLASAPIILVACGIREKAWKRGDGFSALETDVAIVMSHVMLQAADLGLGTCWIADFSPQLVREALKLDEDLIPLALAPLGYPADQPSPKRRRPLSDLVERREE